MKNIILIIASLLLTKAYSAEKTNKVVLSEALLKKLIADDPPNIQQINASFLSIERELLAQKDRFSFMVEGEGQVFESKERLLNNFDGGVTRSATSYSLGVVKPTRYGIDLGLKAFGNKATNAFVSDAATSGVAFSLSLDLYKNFLGRTTDNEIQRSNLNLKRATLEKKASIKSFESNIRKLYWALVANNEQKRLLKTLATLSNTQYKEAKLRQKSGVADSGEVARYRSQWTTRKASLLSLKYRSGEIMKSLKQLLPDLNGAEIELNKYNVEKTIGLVLACSAKIRSHKKAPFQYTPYDEIVGFLNQEEIIQNKVVNTYDDPSIKLMGEYSSVGRDFGFENAQDNWQEDARARTSLGLKISIPFGGSKKATQEVSEKLNRSRYQAEARSNLSKIIAFHSETADIIGILREVVKNQKETNKYLAKSLKVSRKKYKQARIGVQDLISEQDSALQSQLNEIETNLTIINTLMDYFSIYNDIPCALNRI